MIRPEEIAPKVRRSVAFFLKLDLPRDDDEIVAFDAIALKKRPVRDQEADGVATSIRRKMRPHHAGFMLGSGEVQNADTIASLIGIVRVRMS